MSSALHTCSQSVFRTEAWTQAWLDTWGKGLAKEVIDLGGRGNPLEMLYRIPHRFKRIVPVSALCLVGNGFGALSTPRAEYNDIYDLVHATGSIEALNQELNKLRWHQVNFPDIAAEHPEDRQIRSLLSSTSWGTHIIKEEQSYSIENMAFDQYLATLSRSTRLAFFNRRARLNKCGKVERQRFPIIDSSQFFGLLNDFHVHRWGRPCYSSQSMIFMQNFCRRLRESDGEPVLEAITVDGKVVSVLFDVIWRGRRYNLQSGYDEYFANKIPLGSLHLGYAIEDALRAGLNYDFLAGHGKRTDYKARVATKTTSLRTYIATRGYWKLVKTLQMKEQNGTNRQEPNQ